MRTYLLLAFLGIWIAVVPFLPIRCGSTQRLVLLAAGLIVAVIALWSLRETQDK